MKELMPIFQRIHETIAENREQVSLSYISHCQRGPLLDVIQRDRHKDRAVGYSLHGIHRDDLEFCLGGHPMKREGSQGQNKTFAIALKLAQFDFLKRTNSKTTPLLLLDDIFDKLDARRVEQIVKLVAGNDYGQIIEDCGAGFWAIGSEKQRITELFDKLVSNPDLRKKMSLSGLNFYNRNCTPKVAYETMIKQMEGSK